MSAIENDSKVTEYIAGALTASLVAIIGIWLKYYVDKKSADRVERRRIYSMLMGLKTTIRQLEASRAEAFVHSYHHEALWAANLEAQEFAAKEARTKQDLGIDYGNRLAKEKQRLYEELAGASVLFQDQEVRRAIKALYSVNHIEVHPMPTYETKEQAILVMNAYAKEAHSRANENWDRPFSKLLKLIQREL